MQHVNSHAHIYSSNLSTLLQKMLMKFFYKPYFFYRKPKLGIRGKIEFSLNLIYVSQAGNSEYFFSLGEELNCLVHPEYYDFRVIRTGSRYNIDHIRDPTDMIANMDLNGFTRLEEFNYYRLRDFFVKLLSEYQNATIPFFGGENQFYATDVNLGRNDLQVLCLNKNSLNDDLFKNLPIRIMENLEVKFPRDVCDGLKMPLIDFHLKGNDACQFDVFQNAYQFAAGSQPMPLISPTDYQLSRRLAFDIILKHHELTQTIFEANAFHMIDAAEGFEGN